MPPNMIAVNNMNEEVRSEEKRVNRKQDIAWIMLVYFTYITIVAPYGFWLTFTVATWKTFAFTLFMSLLSCMGITAGAHRLWTHKAYKAKMPLQTFLMLCHSATNTHPTIKWVRDHLLHHKYTDTDADPHDATRGFFYSHIGYLLLTKTPECREKGKTIDLTELYANPVLRFQQRHRYWLITVLAFVIPTLIPLLWNETLLLSYHVNIFRVFLVTNASLCVNSVTHKFGTRPYDKTILPTQNLFVSLLTLGEGFHNYHHAFPNDYRTAEFGVHFLNPTTMFIDFCVSIGQAYDCITTSDDVIKARIKRTGDM